MSIINEAHCRRAEDGICQKQAWVFTVVWKLITTPRDETGPMPEPFQKGSPFAILLLENSSDSWQDFIWNFCHPKAWRLEDKTDCPHTEATPPVSNVNLSVLTFNPRRVSLFSSISPYQESVTTSLSRAEAEATLHLMRNYCHLVAVIMEGIYPQSTREEKKEKINKQLVCFKLPSSFIL